MLAWPVHSSFDDTLSWFFTGKGLQLSVPVESDCWCADLAASTSCLLCLSFCGSSPGVKAVSILLWIFTRREGCVCPFVDFHQAWVRCLPFVAFHQAWGRCLPFLAFHKAWGQCLPFLAFHKAWGRYLPFLAFHQAWGRRLPFGLFTRREGGVCPLWLFTSIVAFHQPWRRCVLCGFSPAMRAGKESGVCLPAPALS